MSKFKLKDQVLVTKLTANDGAPKGYQKILPFLAKIDQVYHGSTPTYVVDVDDDFAEAVTGNRYGYLNLRDSNLELCEDVEKAKAQKAILLKQATKEAEAAVKKIFTKRTSYKTRLIRHGDLNTKASTGYNFVQQGSIKEGNFTVRQHLPSQRCCSFTRNSSYDLKVFIQKPWLEIYGYNEADLLRWLKFLKEMGVGFDYIYTGKSPLIKQLGGHERNIKYSLYNGLLTTGTEGCYTVILPKQKVAKRNYLCFILLRYMYNDLYWSIPGLAMQIKNSLGKKVTNWEALLMAHLHYSYEDYYCLVRNKPLSIANPFQNSLERVNPLYDNSNAMTTTLTYQAIPVETRSAINKCFGTQDYETLLNLLKK